MKKTVFHKRKFTKYLINSLLREKVKNVSINGWISLEYDGEKIKYKIIIKKHEHHVGNWAEKKNEVFIDDDLKGQKNIDAIALHEAIEKFITQKYGLDGDTDAHRIAETKEREFFEKADGSWRSHQMKVVKVWLRERKK